MSHEYDNLSTILDTMVDIEIRRARLWKEELKHMPGGSLYCSKRADGVYYYRCVDQMKTGISRDLEMLYLLARKKYLKSRISDQRQEFSRISRILRSGKYRKSDMTKTEKLLHYYGEQGLDILRITCSKEQYLWAKGNFIKNQMNPEQLIFETYSGIKVRSKSERDIGNALEINGIPYRYEMGIDLDISWMQDINGCSMGMYKTYYPDFTILTLSGEYIIWEHLGRVDMQDYRIHNMEKIAAYRQSGHFPEHSLILTFEADLRSRAQLTRIIETRILPYAG